MPGQSALQKRTPIVRPDDSRYTSSTTAALAAGNADLQKLTYRMGTSVVGTWSDTSGWEVQSISADGITIIGRLNSGTAGSLGTSINDGATWTVIKAFTYTIRGAWLLPSGEVLVGCQNGGNRTEIWLSTGWATNPGTATWTMVRQGGFTVLSSYPVTEYRCVTADGAGNVWQTDYGKKTNVGGDPTLTGVRLWHSTNNGTSWVEQFRLDTWLTNVLGKTDLTTVGYHIHGVTWDSYWNRLWLTFGDYATSTAGAAGILYSDDLGATWSQYWITNGSENRFQTVGITPLENALILHPDGNPSGLYRIARNGYRAPAATPEEVVHLASTGSQAIGMQSWRAPYAGAPLIVAVTQQNSTGGTLSRLLATADGVNFVTLYKDSAPPTVTLFGNLNYVVGPTASGKILASSQTDGRYASGKSLLTIPVGTLV